MIKKIMILCLVTLSAVRHSMAQMYIRDQSVINQQERMVFKQWDQHKFTPAHGFLYLNPLYWMTWAWFPGYPKTDRRPLGPVGPQTQRLALAAAMQNTDDAYKLQADTLRNTAITEAVNYSGLVSGADPLWVLYYSRAFDDLLNQQDPQLLRGVPPNVQTYLVNSGTYDWYLQQSHSLAARLNAARTTILDRGSRILTYYRLLSEYRRLNAIWATKKQQVQTFLTLGQRAKNRQSPTGSPIPFPKRYQTDRQIADQILSHYKL